MNKEKIALLVDSGTDVPEALVKQYGMYVLPLQIIYPEKTYTDKVDITPEEVYQRLEKEIPIRAAELIETGLGWQELQQKLTEEVANAKVFFNVATLEYLQKGGRIGLVTSILGNALKLNPIISCNEEGIYYTVAKSRGRKKSLDKTFELVTNFIGEAPRFRLAVAHGAAEEEAKAMMERLKAAFPQAEEIYFGTISPALVVHTGPGLLGVGIQLLND